MQKYQARWTNKKGKKGFRMKNKKYISVDAKGEDGAGQ
jgi:hypothetical protein